METTNSKRDEQNYYEILEISADAPHHEIVAAYERAKETYSPDSASLYSMFTEQEAQDLRRLIEEAYLVLSNQAKRREYDLVLKVKMKQPEAGDLPDFTPQEQHQQQQQNAAARNGNFQKTIVKESSEGKLPPSPTSGAIPAGFAKSRLSVYEINANFEAEVAAMKEFDGETLKKIRQYKNINIEQMSKETRISRSYLAAVEANDYEALPAAVFARGFVVQIARLLNLDDNLVAQSYMSKFKKK